MVDNLWDINFCHLSPKRGQKTEYQDLNFWPANDKNVLKPLF